jgi:hypothetical protein
MRSFDPSSRVTVPPPDQLPAMPAKAPDCACPPVDADRQAANKMAAAKGSRLKRAP